MVKGWLPILERDKRLRLDEKSVSLYLLAGSPRASSIVFELSECGKVDMSAYMQLVLGFPDTSARRCSNGST